MLPSTQQLEPIAKKFELDLAVLFGSRATGRVHSESDWDIAVRGRRVLNLADRLDLIGEFQRFFGNDVDLIDIRTAGPVLLACIGDNGKALFERGPSTLAEFKLFALTQYRDARPWLDKLKEDNRRRVAELGD